MYNTFRGVGVCKGIVKIKVCSIKFTNLNCYYKMSKEQVTTIMVYLTTLCNSLQQNSQ